jgi:uncharacterized protein YfaS (alpha-2-macroglobulin family)
MLPSGKTEDVGQPTVGDLILVTLKVKVPGDISYVVIDDPLPASFEAVQQTFASQSAANPAAGKVGWGRWNTDHEELRDDRALFFTNHFYGSGNYQVQYLARVSGVGDTMAGQAKIEAMYDPERRGLSGSTRITTQPRAKDKETAGR